MADSEVAERFVRVAFLDADILDDRGRRAMLRPGDQPVKRILAAFGHDFDRAVGQIADVSVQSKLPGFLLCKHSEADALNEAADGDVNPPGHGDALHSGGRSGGAAADIARAFYRLASDQANESANYD
jgi:hypothetical protein